MFYINPLYKDFIYTVNAKRHEMVDILESLVNQYDGIMPRVEQKTQTEFFCWNLRNKKQLPRLQISWDVPRMSEEVYRRLGSIFAESVLDDDEYASRVSFQKKRIAPARYLDFDGHTTGKKRGFPLYSDPTLRLDPDDFSREPHVLWITRTFPTIKDAQEKMRGRGRNYWFFSDGRFSVDLHVATCKEIEFIDAALRTSVALNGSYDAFDRFQALSYAQKELARLDAKEVRQDDLIGLEEMIDDVKFRQFFATTHPAEAQSLGVTDESILLVGVPGTGKSSIAGSLLWDRQLEEVPIIPLNVTELLEASYSSDTQIGGFFDGIKDLHRRYQISPMLWCDDLESAFLQDASRMSREMAVTQSNLLNHLQGVSKDHGVRISGSTNYPEKIEPRFLEFGRISYMFHVPIPTDPQILSRILATHIKDRDQMLAENCSLDEIAQRSIGYTPRMLVNLVNEAGVQAAKRIFKHFNAPVASEEALEVRAEDYERADAFLRTRSDLKRIQDRDKEIAEFVDKHNRGNIGFKF